MMDQIGELSNNVKENIRFFEERKIWYALSNNPESVSCADAAAKRKRLGQTGIPIFDELKSELGYFTNSKGETQQVLVHCRGNQKLDRQKVSLVLGAEYQRYSGARYIKGMVNPFNKEFRDLLQIFDITTTKHFHPPYTMMTNAGDRTHAFEFKARTMIEALENARVANVIRADNTITYKRHKIGILTGNGPDSGMLLWKLINKEIKNAYESRGKGFFAGDLVYPEITVSSVPDMGISMELGARSQEVLKIVRKSVTELCQSGITILCIACNTTQRFHEAINEICELYNVVFGSISEALELSLEAQRCNTFYIVGISSVVDIQDSGEFIKVDGKYTVIIPDKINADKIKQIAYLAKTDINLGLNRFLDFMKSINAPLVVVALTEISTIIDKYPKTFKDYTIIDSLHSLAEYVAKKYVDNVFDTLFVDKSVSYSSICKVSDTNKKGYKNALTALLQEIDHEFIPPLSRRWDTKVTDFSVEASTSNGLDNYIFALSKQENIMCIRKEDNKIIGFMSYTPDDLPDFMNNKECYYITTVGVTKSERGKGIAADFYREIEEIAINNGVPRLLTRVWSTNVTHIKILLEHGYDIAKTFPNDRAPGIDTVYYLKEL